MRILALKSLGLTWFLSPNLSIYFNFVRCWGPLWYNHIRRFSVHSRFIEKSMCSIYIMYCLLRRAHYSKSGKWSTIIANSKWTQLFCNFNMFETFFKAMNAKHFFHSFRQCTEDQKEWRALVHTCNWMSLAWHCVLLVRSPVI